MIYALLRIFIMLLIILPFGYGLYMIFIQSNILFKIIIVTVYVVTILGILLSFWVDLIW
jgi:hypothetical protein